MESPAPDYFVPITMKDPCTSEGLFASTLGQNWTPEISAVSFRRNDAESCGLEEMTNLSSLVPAWMTRKVRFTIRLVPFTTTDGQPEQTPGLQVSTQSELSVQLCPANEPPVQVIPAEQVELHSAAVVQGRLEFEVQSRHSEAVEHVIAELLLHVFGPVITTKEVSRFPKLPHASPVAGQSVSCPHGVLPSMRQNFAPPALAAEWLSTQTGLVSWQIGLMEPQFPKSVSGRMLLIWMKDAS